MPVEIERKFLVVDDRWRNGCGPGQRYCQGYLAAGGNGGGGGRATVRVRRAGPAAWITVKGPSGGSGRVRAEYEYPIPVDDAEQMLEHLCRRPLLAKTRHEVVHAGRLWQVDLFEGCNAGLVLAEVELGPPDEPVAPPPWVGAEVTADLRYRNSALAGRPMGRGRSGLSGAA